MRVTSPRRCGYRGREPTVHLVLSLLVDGVLLLGLVVSFILATRWGELCGIEPHRDKSGLGGFFAVSLFLPLRWACTCVGLAWGLWNGTLPFFAQTSSGLPWTVLGAHAAIGVAVVLLFQHGLKRVQ